METTKRNPSLPPSVLALALGAFAIGTESFVIAGILRELAADLRVGVPVAGQLVTAFALAYAVAAPTLSVLTGGLRRDRVLKVAIAAFAAANLLAAAAPSYGFLMAARILLAVSAGLYMPTASAHAAASVDPAHRGRALAVVYAGLTAALVLGVPFGTFVGNHLGWRATFVAVAILAGLSAAGVAAFVARQPASPRVGFAARLAVLRRPEIVVAFGVTGLTLCGAFTVYTYLGEFMLKTTGIAGDKLGLILLLFGAGGAAGTMLGGVAADRMPPERAVGVILTLAIAVFAALSLAARLPPGAAVVVIPILVTVWGVVGWSFTTAQQARLVALAPELAPIVLSFNASATYVGISLGSVIGSVVVAHGAVTSLGWAAAALIAGAGLLALGSRAEAVVAPRA